MVVPKVGLSIFRVPVICQLEKESQEENHHFGGGSKTKKTNVQALERNGQNCGSGSLTIEGRLHDVNRIRLVWVLWVSLKVHPFWGTPPSGSTLITKRIDPISMITVLR